MKSTKYGENVLPGKGEMKAMKYTINLLRPVQTYTDIEIMARKVAKLGRRREMCKARNAVFARLTGDLGRGFESRVTHAVVSTVKVFSKNNKTDLARHIGNTFRPMK